MRFNFIINCDVLNEWLSNFLNADTEVCCFPRLPVYSATLGNGTNGLAVILLTDAAFNGLTDFSKSS